MSLVLSLFPGIGLLDMAFEEAGFCVVRGPDLLWGGDIRRFHPPAGKFDGVIGGPPCQAFSPLRLLVEYNCHKVAPNLIPEYERVVRGAAPTWWLMEEVPEAPAPHVDGYATQEVLVRDVWVGGATSRLRRFSYGGPGTFHVAQVGDRLVAESRRLAESVRFQGLPADFLSDAPFTVAGKIKAIGNGVPLPMGRAVAKAVLRATGATP